MAATNEPVETFLRRHCRDEIGELAQHYPGEQQSLRIDWRDLYRFDHDLADRLLEDPTEVLREFETALREYDLPADVDLGQARVRVGNLPRSHDPATVSRHENLDRYVAVSGQVSKRTRVSPKVTEAAFRCVRCEVLTRVSQDDATLQEPHECRGCERKGPFRLDRRQSRFVNHQAIRVQQPPEETDGADARYIDVHLEDDVTNEVAPGDRVTVAGVLDLAEDDMDSPVFDTQLRAYDARSEESDFEDVDVGEHVEDIRAIARGERGDPYELLRESIHPTHEGDPEIKFALGLQLFSGWAREYPNGKRDRGDIHVLLLGDPGCDKSGMLAAQAELAPRSVYTSGKGASGVGLTAAAVKDDFGDGQWTLEAGALVLASGGVACVDEIDKMSEEAVSSMHEALEGQQQVNVNKAGIDATLNARSSLAAAGNPKGGRFDPYQPPGPQVDLDPALLSRFDLIFMLTDQPDRDEDAQVVGGMIDSRAAAGKYTRGEGLDEAERETIEPPVSRELLRAWVAYAKQNVFPVIEDDDVKRSLKRYFVELRQANEGGASDDNPVPVTFRKVEAIERLAEASARVRLSETVTQADVERAVQEVETSLRQVGRDPESDQFDADVVEVGSSHSQRDRVRRIKEALGDLGDATMDDLDADLEDTDRAAIERSIANLKDKGEVYEVTDGTYRLTL